MQGKKKKLRLKHTTFPVRNEAVVYEQLAEPFSLQSCSTEGLWRMSSAVLTHQLSTVAACFQCSGQYCTLFWILLV